MAWLRIEKVDEGPLKETYQADGTVRATVSQKWLVVSDAAVTQDQCLTASISSGEPPVVVAKIPVYRQSYSTSRKNCRVRARRVEQETSHKAFVHVEYEDLTGGESTADLLSKAARITDGGEVRDEAYMVDATGAKVVNPAGEVFDNPPTRPVALPVYTIRKYVNATTKGQIKAARDTTNLNEVTISGDVWAANEALLEMAIFQTVDEVDSVWEAAITVKCKKGGWVDSPLAVGFRQKDGKEIRISKTTGAIDLVNGERPSVAWPLETAGANIGLFKTGTPPTADAMAFYPKTRHAWTGVPLS